MANIKNIKKKADTAKKNATRAEELIEDALEQAVEDLKPETKSKTATFLLRPTVYENARNIALVQKTTVNNIINILLEQYVQDNLEDLEKYKAVFGE